MERLEFGNKEHIEMLKKAQYEQELIETALKKGFVGMEMIESCKGCGCPLSEVSVIITHEGKKYRVCAECDSVINKI